MSELRFHLTPLTPLHIGGGYKLEPFEYVVTRDALYHFTLDALMLSLPEDKQAQFVEMVEKGVAATRDFVLGHTGAAMRVALWRGYITEAARDLYFGQTEHRSSSSDILACIRTEQQLYVPASSLKGAIRTAFLYQMMEKPNTSDKANLLEKAVFKYKNYRSDPFRALKISDGPPLSVESDIQAITVNTWRRGAWRKDNALLVETLQGWLSNRSKIVSSHAGQIDDDFYRLHPDAPPFGAEQLLNACRDFYGTHLATEQAYHALLPETATIYKSLAEYAQDLPAHACLIRLGWGTGQDANTTNYALSGAKYPTSRRLTHDGYPLGWAKLSLTDINDNPLEVSVSIPAIATEPLAKVLPDFTVRPQADTRRQSRPSRPRGDNRRDAKSDTQGNNRADAKRESQGGERSKPKRPYSKAKASPPKTKDAFAEMPDMGPPLSSPMVSLKEKLTPDSAPSTEPTSISSPPPTSEGGKYSINTEVNVTITGQWKKGRVEVELPDGSKGFLKISRKQLEQIAGKTVTLAVESYKNDIVYLVEL